MALAKESFESALASTLKELNLSFSLKVEQETALKSFISKKDVFGVLPTGYGKSLIYRRHPALCSDWS